MAGQLRLRFGGSAFFLRLEVVEELGVHPPLLRLGARGLEDVFVAFHLWIISGGDGQTRGTVHGL